MKTAIWFLGALLVVGCTAPVGREYTCEAGNQFPVEPCDPGPQPGPEWQVWLGCDEPDQWIVDASGACGAGWLPDVPAMRLACDGVSDGPASCAWGCGWFRAPHEDECAVLAAMCDAEPGDACFSPAQF